MFRSVAQLRQTAPSCASFGGGDGLVTTDFGGYDDFTNVLVLQDDGSILVARASSDSSHPELGLFADEPYLPRYFCLPSWSTTKARLLALWWRSFGGAW